MAEVYSREELNKKVDLLNALTNEYYKWQYTKARKNHVDLFGDHIDNGEIYFKRENGSAYDDVIKISEKSMERLLYALFSYNPQLEIVADHLAKKRMEELRNRLNEALK